MPLVTIIQKILLAVTVANRMKLFLAFKLILLSEPVTFPIIYIVFIIVLFFENYIFFR